MEFELKYGKTIKRFCIKEKNYMGSLIPNAIEFDVFDEGEVRHALANPIESRPLREIVSAGEKVVVITSDITRPMPSSRVLPSVIKELKKGGVCEKDITVVLALGSHRKHTEDEKKALVGDEVAKSNVNVIDSDINRCIRLGICKNGTPADIFEPVVKADRRICLGNIEFHYFAGYSGGCKAVMPGVSSHEAIMINHSNMIKAGAFAGNIDTNPVRQDIEEIADFIPIDFIVNVVLDEQKRIVRAFAGHPVKAHRAGVGVLDDMYKVSLSRPADVVILSPGGFPKDINMYQAHKGLDNAKHAVKEGGILIWCARAAEGFGEKTFEEWMITKSADEMIEEISANFRLGAHKAAAVAMVLKKATIYMVSDLPFDLMRKVGIVPFVSIEKAINAALHALGDDAKILIMPEAGSTLPVLCRCLPDADSL